jgi:imidazolonepropionase-like amidohydrolase
MALLVQAGLSPREALTAATAAPAEVFGLSDRGRIAAGLTADLLLVRGDPTADINATSEIVAIWRGGVRVDRAMVPAEART